jgi:hypothetical protein
MTFGLFGEQRFLFDAETVLSLFIVLLLELRVKEAGTNTGTTCVFAEIVLKYYKMRTF